MLHVVVDGANVVGSRPDGWWHDRAGAARRLAGQLVAALVADPDRAGHGAGRGAGRRGWRCTWCWRGPRPAPPDLPTHPQLTWCCAPADGD